MPNKTRQGKEEGQTHPEMLLLKLKKAAAGIRKSTRCNHYGFILMQSTTDSEHKELKRPREGKTHTEILLA